MPDPNLPRASQQLPLTRNHLYALGALALSLAALAFFVGLQLGRGNVVAAPPPPVARFIPPEVAEGDLEVLLASVERASVGEVPLGFPAELPRPEPPPAVVPPVDGAVVVSAPVPVPNPFPVEPRSGTASLEPSLGVVAPPTSDIPTSGWSIQVAEHEVEADAERYVETLRAAGLAAYRVVALVGGVPVWRVRIGGYGNKDVATAALPGVVSKAGAAEATVTRAP